MRYQYNCCFTKHEIWPSKIIKILKFLLQEPQKARKCWGLSENSRNEFATIEDLSKKRKQAIDKKIVNFEVDTLNCSTARVRIPIQKVTYIYRLAVPQTTAIRLRKVLKLRTKSFSSKKLMLRLLNVPQKMIRFPLSC